LNTQDKQELAKKVRRHSVEMVYGASSGHVGGSLSIADLLVELYFGERYCEKDRFVLSKGHASPALYATLALKGFMKEEELKTFRQVGSPLQGHPKMDADLGVDMSTGSLGQGVSCACGMAIGDRNTQVWTILGDGECQEGQVWESFMFANHYKLSNLCVIIDYNDLQISGKLSDCMTIESLADKLKAFGFNLLEIDGHDFEEIQRVYANAIDENEKPTAIIAKTVKGKGVSFMENEAGWHGTAPNQEQYEKAMEELK